MNAKVTAYIEKQTTWKEALKLVRTILLKLPVEETIK